MLMKTRQVLSLIVFILFIAGWQAPVRAQDLPINYNQNPNMEHEFSTIFWSGFDDTWFGIYSHPWDYLTKEYAHSGSHSMEIWVQPGGAYGTWIWVSYPVRGHEQKKFKASFWYRGYLMSYWNFLYRDAGLTFEDLPPELVEYTGADTAYWGGAGQNAIKFDFGGDNDFTADWTYFEFVWDFPGTIPGWGNTAMWYANRDSAYVDDIYYGEWYDGQYSGEEPFGFINGDFEYTQLNYEWLVNVSVGGAKTPDDFISLDENHSEAGFQSLRLMDYKTVTIDTLDVVAPYDSISIDTSSNDRNVTYFLPAAGAEGEDMDLSFWYKGNEATVSLEFYDDYGVTTEELPLPAGATLYVDSANPVYEIDTTDILMDITFDTMAVDNLGNFSSYLELLTDTVKYQTEEVLTSQNFDDQNNLAISDGAWLWLPATGNWNNWAAAVSDYKPWSSPGSLNLPGDPGWGSAEGYVNVVDDTNYVWEFMYKGQIQFYIKLGDTKYDLVNDPEGIVPADATADATSITWNLNSKYWTPFRFEYTQGSWLADSSVASPKSIAFGLVGSLDAADNGYVDDLLVALTSDAAVAVIDTNYLVVESDTSYTYVTDTTGITYNQVGARWDLPSAAEWTEWNVNWTNPSTDIGSTLTLMLDNAMPAAPDYLTPEKPEFNDDHAGWTYFDDFVYEITTGINNKQVQQKDLHIYPNPVADILYLSIEDQLQRINIYNSVGQLVKSINNPDRKINVSDLSSGIYMLNVTDQRGIVYKSKFIKE